ncbi:MAG TPA: hypothetical protein VHE81_23215, partial [Lacipirellulaceae bacterium]|nr:hypothetical protein [Lacipirellulaceae bacterium]
MKITNAGRFLGCMAAISFAVLASNANGSMLVSDSFSYSDGNLVPNDPPIGGAWNAHSGAGSVAVQVSSGTIGLAQGSGSREDVNVPFEGGFAAGAGSVLYSGFDLTVPDPGTTITSTYFAHFLQGTSNFTSRLWVTTPSTIGYRLALSNDSALDLDGEAYSGDLVFGTTYRVVTKYDFDNQNGEMWINPVDESSPSFAATDPGFSDAVNAYAFRQAAGNTNQTIDNLYVSTTFQGALT